MSKLNQNDLVVAEGEMEVDARTATAIEKGLRDVRAGRVVPSEKVPELVRQWIASHS